MEDIPETIVRIVFARGFVSNRVLEAAFLRPFLGFLAKGCEIDGRRRILKEFRGLR
jgi:hypothetical protein